MSFKVGGILPSFSYSLYRFSNYIILEKVNDVKSRKKKKEKNIYHAPWKQSASASSSLLPENSGKLHLKTTDPVEIVPRDIYVILLPDNMPEIV